METVVHLIRHGLVENPNNTRYGQLPGFVLSRRGEDQARAAGRYLRTAGAGIAAMISSPLERATGTAALLQEELGLAAYTTDDRLIEATNVFDGKSRNAPLFPWNWPSLPNPFGPSWGEKFSSIADRMRAAIAAHAVRDAQVVLVSHQAPIWITRHSYEGWGPPWLSRVRCAHASITSLRFDGNRYLGHSYWTPG